MMTILQKLEVDLHNMKVDLQKTQRTVDITRSFLSDLTAKEQKQQYEIDQMRELIKSVKEKPLP